jgi:hypothetical protein
LYSISYVTGTLTVTVAPLTIIAPSATLTYGDAVPTLSPTYTGVVGSDIAASLTTKPTCATTYTKGAGVSSYTTSCPGAAISYYTIGYTSGSITVNPTPLSITASSGSMTYGLPDLHLRSGARVRNSSTGGVPRSTAMKMIGHKTESIYKTNSTTASARVPSKSTVPSVSDGTGRLPVKDDRRPTVPIRYRVARRES